ncbi:MAG: zinc-binding dehydrogenase [Pseudomonadota bacterium]
MRALRLTGERALELSDIPAPDAPGTGEVQVAIKAMGLNHIDVWGWRGMAFAKRELPIVVGVEAAGEIVAVGDGVTDYKAGDRVAMYGAKTCGECRYSKSGMDNLCENVRGIMGFHLDGFARDRLNIEQQFLVPVPDGVSWVHAACSPVTFGTPVHMLFDNAKLEAGETILIQAGGSGVGSAAIRLSKHVGATVITTVGDDEKAEKARALGADHVINYREERFESRARRLTDKKGVDVVFEHVGPDTWEGSIFALSKGGRLVTCGSTTGVSSNMNLFTLYQQQLRIIGSFGCRMENIAQSLDFMAKGVLPVIDTEIALEDFETGLERLETRRVFGKIVVTF